MTLQQKLRRSANHRAYYHRNRATILARKREYYLANRQAILARNLAYKRIARADGGLHP